MLKKTIWLQKHPPPLSSAPPPSLWLSYVIYVVSQREREREREFGQFAAQIEIIARELLFVSTSGEKYHA